MQRVLLLLIMVLLLSCKLNTQKNQPNVSGVIISCLNERVMVEAKNNLEVGYSEDSTEWRLFYFSKPMYITSLSTINDKELLNALKNKDFIVDTIGNYCLSYIFLKSKNNEARIKLSFFECEERVNGKDNNGFTVDFNTTNFSQDSIKLFSFLNNLYVKTDINGEKQHLNEDVLTSYQLVDEIIVESR